MQTRKCQTCQLEFAKPITNSKKVWGERRFCSLKCYGDSIADYSTTSKQCLNCGITFSRSRGDGLKQYVQRKYCSHKCSELATIGKKNGQQTAEHKAKMVATRRANGSYRKGEGKGASEKAKMNEVLSKKRWKLEHPEIVNHHTRLRSYRLRGAEGKHSYAEWEAMKNRFDRMCLCCKRKEPEIVLTEDHIVPIVLGGSNYISNIQPLCKSCNSRKSMKNIDYISLYQPRVVNI